MFTQHAQLFGACALIRLMPRLACLLPAVLCVVALQACAASSYQSLEEEERIIGLQLESELSVASVRDEKMEEMRAYRAALKDRDRSANEELVLAVDFLGSTLMERTRTGIFEVSVCLTPEAAALIAGDSLSVHLTGLSEQEVIAERAREDDGELKFDERTVTLLLDRSNSTATLPRSALIWKRWVLDRAVALRVYLTPFSLEPGQPLKSRTKLLGLDPRGWRSDRIRLLVTESGLMRDSIPANPIDSPDDP